KYHENILQSLKYHENILWSLKYLRSLKYHENILTKKLTPWRYSPWRALAYQPAAGLRVTHALRHGGEPSSNQ
ncbi:hypothetical protein C0J52_21569, partial [Blattella germanica]